MCTLKKIVTVVDLGWDSGGAGRMGPEGLGNEEGFLLPEGREP